MPAVYFDPIAVTTAAGDSTASFADGKGSQARFNAPASLAAGKNNDIFIADALNYRVRRMDKNGVVSTFAGNGISAARDGQGVAAGFVLPGSICMGKDGMLYVIDNQSSIRKISPGGTVTTLIDATGWHIGEGPGWLYPFPSFRGIAADAAGNVFVCDGSNNAIRKVSPTGEPSLFAWNGSTAGGNTILTDQLLSPSGLAFDRQNNLFVTQVYNNPVKISNGGAVEVINIPGFYGFKTGIAIDQSDNIFLIVDVNNYISQVYKFTPSLQLSLLAGDVKGKVDSIGADAKFSGLSGITIDSEENIFLTEASYTYPTSYGNWIRKMSKPAYYFSANAGTPTPARYFSVSGNALDGTAWLEAPKGYELSMGQSGPWSSGMAIGSNAGEIASVKVYLRLGGNIAGGIYNDSLVLHANGAVTQKMAVFGLVTDIEPPAVQCIPAQTLCYNSSKNYIIPAISATDVSGIKYIHYTVSGATVRAGNGADASRQFNPGKSLIVWTVADNAGNSSTCSVSVRIGQPLSVSLPDVYPLLFWGLPNSLYLGFGPADVTLTALPSGGTKLPGANYTYAWSNGANTKSIIVHATTAGSYSYGVTITDSLGCQSTATKTINVIDVRCGNRLNKVLVCWPNKHGNIESCVNDNQALIALLFGARLGSCGNGSQRAIDPGTTDVVKGISIFPNPNNGTFVLQLNQLSDVDLRVLDQSGRIISRQMANGGNNVQRLIMNLGRVANGLYLVEAISKEGVYTTKMLVQQ